MRARLLLLASAVAAPLACSSSPQGGTQVALVPNVVVPADLIGMIQTFSIQIYSTAGGIGCDTTTGAITGNVMSATKIASDDQIKETGCPTGVAACATFSGGNAVPYQTVPSVISVTGSGPGGTLVGSGCAQTMINEASLSVTVNLVRVIPPAMCGSGTVEPPETCNEPTNTTAACDEKTCETYEELLSYGDVDNAGTETGSVGQKTNPFLLWSTGSGATSADSAGVLMAVFTDSALSGSLQITARFMDDTLSPTNLYGPTVAESSIYVPNSTTMFPPMQAADDDKQPSAAAIAGVDYVVFSSDFSTTDSDAFDIYFDSFSQMNLTAQQSSPCPVSQGMSTSTYAATAPSVAASGSALYAAWQDSSGNVLGRMITPNGTCGTLGKQATLGSGTNAKVAAAGSGWVVAWQSGSSISMQLIGSTGAPSGSVQTVDSGSSPSVASVPPSAEDFAIAYAGSKGIQVQRYTSAGVKIAASDSTIGVNTATSDMVATPAIAGGSQAGGFYVVTWIDSSTGPGVMGRLLSATSGLLTDASGYLFNTIDGSANDFAVNVTTGRSPANPTVAVGGAGYIAFGWEDHGSSCPMASTFPGTPCWGIVARRFPVPTE
jgi:hypothetical protein